MKVKKANPTLIGGFVVGAILLMIFGLIFFSQGKFFTKTKKWVMFFDSSVAGLYVGAPVNFRGVQIGSVVDILMQVNYEEVDVRTPVIVQIEANRITLVNGEKVDFDKDDDFAYKLIERGLRAQLVTQSFVTGQLAVEYDFYPDAPVNLVGAYEGVPEFPTIPSKIQELGERLEKLPLNDLVTATLHMVQSMDNMVQSIDKIVGAGELKETILLARDSLKETRDLVKKISDQASPILANISAVTMEMNETLKAAQVDLKQGKQSLSEMEQEFSEAMREARTLAKNINDKVDPLATQLSGTLKSTKEAVDGGKKTLKLVQEAVDTDSTLRFELDNALRELSTAARSIRILSDYLARHPDALLYGKAGAPKRR